MNQIENQLNKKYDHIERTKEEDELVLRDTCTFTPEITNRSRDICDIKGTEPIHMRYEREHRKKERRLEKERQLKQEKVIKSLKKKPKLNTIPKDEDHDGKGEKKDLYKQGKEWLQRRNMKILEIQAEEMERQFEESEKLYKPRINERSRSTVKMNFIERQKMYQKRRDRNKRSLIAKEKSTFPFTPRLNLKSLKMVKKAEKESGLQTKTSRGILDDPDKQTKEAINEVYLKFYDDYSKKNLIQQLKEEERERILESKRKKKEEQQRKLLKEGLYQRLYNTAGKENQSKSYVLAKKPKKNNQAAVVIREYRAKSKSQNKLTSKSPTQSVLRSRSRLSPNGKQVSKNKKGVKKVLKSKRRGGTTTSPRKAGRGLKSPNRVFEVEFDEEFDSHLRSGYLA